MMAQPAKRRRLEITAGIKKKICQHKVDHPKATIQDIRQFILTEDAMDILLLLLLSPLFAINEIIFFRNS